MSNPEEIIDNVKNFIKDNADRQLTETDEYKNIINNLPDNIINDPEKCKLLKRYIREIVENIRQNATENGLREDEDNFPHEAIADADELLFEFNAICTRNSSGGRRRRNAKSTKKNSTKKRRTNKKTKKRKQRKLRKRY